MASGQTHMSVGPYTAAQADAGRTAYLSHCASCHLPDLGGRNEAAQLAGSNFMRAWGARATSELLTFIRTTMPPGNRGNLGDRATPPRRASVIGEKKIAGGAASRRPSS